MFLRMGEIIARNMLSWLKLFINTVIVVSTWLFISLYKMCYEGSSVPEDG